MFTVALTCLAAAEAVQGDQSTSDKAIARSLAAAEPSGHVYSMCRTLAFADALPAIIRGYWSAVEQAAE